VTAAAPGPRLRVALLTREYPPEVYGGAGVHVTYLARELAGLVDVTVHCQGADRPDAVAHRPWDHLAGANPALGVMSADLSMAAATGSADVVHSHTWYANLGGHLASLLYGVPHLVTVHSLEPLRPWKAEQLGGGYALSSWCERVAVEAAAAVVAVSAGMRDDVLAAYPAVSPDRVRVIRNGIDLRGGPGPAVGDLRGQDHPAEGRPGAAAGGGRPGSFGPARALRRPAGHSRACRRGGGPGGGPARGAVRGDLDTGDAAQARGDPVAHARNRVRLPLAL